MIWQPYSQTLGSALRQIEQPVIEPLDIEFVKKALKFQTTTEDVLIDMWISAAREFFEDQTDRQVMGSTWEYSVDAYPGVIELPRPPLLSVISINGEAVDEDAYVVTAPKGPRASCGTIENVGGGSWPVITTSPGAVVVRYRAGYGEARGDVPALVKAAMLMLIGTMFRFRAETHDAARGAVQALPFGSKQIMDSFRYTAMPVHPVRVASSWQG